MTSAFFSRWKSKCLEKQSNFKPATLGGSFILSGCWQSHPSSKYSWRYSPSSKKKDDIKLYTRIAEKDENKESGQK